MGHFSMMVFVTIYKKINKIADKWYNLQFVLVDKVQLEKLQRQNRSIELFLKILRQRIWATYLENESTFWKWKHIPKMKAHSENDSTFWKWKQILKMKAHFENKSTLWKWKHILKMQVHFVTVKTEGKCPWSDYWIDNRTSAWNLIISWFILLCMPYYYILHTILCTSIHTT